MVSFSKCLRLIRSTRSSVLEDLYQDIWWIEKDEVAIYFATVSACATKVQSVQLFLQSAHSAHLRKLIVDLETPRFDSG